MSDPQLLSQHCVTSTKLYIAKRHCALLRELVPTQKATDLEKIEFGKKHEIIHELSTSLPIKNLQFYDELEFIFYNLRSCIDSFLWEINMIFNLGFSRISNFRKFLEKLNEECKDKEVTKLLNHLQGESWFKYISNVRNNLTHRLLSEVATWEDLRRYLPSISFTIEPSPFHYSLEKEYELFPCLDRLLENTKGLLEKGYETLLDEFNIN